MTVLESAPELVRKTEEEPASVKRVCFICTGNTCRSPMAAAVANALAFEPISKLPEAMRSLAAPELEAFSAGLYASSGDPITPNAVLALETAGIPVVPGRDYHSHTAHRICAEEAERYELLIGMTQEHTLMLLMQFPHLAQRITSLPVSIPDPFGGDAETYKACLAQIVSGVRQLLFPGSAES